MDCSEFRQRIEVDPADIDEAGAAHERACTACAAYAQRLRAAERLLGDALRFDVAQLRARGAAPGTPQRGMPMRTGWAMAASAGAAALAVWLGMTFVPSEDPAQLALAVQEHWYHEPSAWVQTSAQVAPAALASALSGQARVDLDRLDVVSYARSCLVNGRWVPHLVVQGEVGPVMVLLLSREAVDEAVPLDLPQEGLRGVIVPLDEASVAILGEDEEPLESLQQTLSEAVEWTI